MFDAHGGEPYYAYSAEARPNENVCAALSERLPSDYLRIRRREKRFCLPCAYNNFQNQTATEIKLEFIIHFIHTYVCMRKQIDAAETQAEPSLPFWP